MNDNEHKGLLPAGLGDMLPPEAALEASVIETLIESPAATGNRCTQSSSVRSINAFSNRARVTPRLRPTIRCDPGAQAAIYQFSVPAP